jgi:hypothetical protein
LIVSIDRMTLPCWSCSRPEAEDCRFWLGSASDDDVERQLSPSGFPPICCRVRVVVVMPKPDTGAAPR